MGLVTATGFQPVAVTVVPKVQLLRPHVAQSTSHLFMEPKSGK